MKGLTDEEVAAEIELLKNDPDVKLGRYEQRLQYRQRQYLYTLRAFKKHGKELRKSGITAEMLSAAYEAASDNPAAE